MLTEFQKKWVWALRSGQYKQARNTLRNSNNNSFCCLGVACDLISNRWDRRTTYMPEKPELDKMGINQQFASILAGKNDDGWDFNQIADFIEETLGE